MSNTDTYTVSHAIDALGFGKYQIILSLVVGMAYVADAMEMMLLSVLAPALHCHWQITQLQQASLTTVVFFGKFCLLWKFWDPIYAVNIAKTSQHRKTKIRL